MSVGISRKLFLDSRFKVSGNDGDFLLELPVDVDCSRTSSFFVASCSFANTYQTVTQFNNLLSFPFFPRWNPRRWQSPPTLDRPGAHRPLHTTDSRAGAADSSRGNKHSDLERVVGHLRHRVPEDRSTSRFIYCPELRRDRCLVFLLAGPSLCADGGNMHPWSVEAAVDQCPAQHALDLPKQPAGLELPVWHRRPLTPS